MEKRYAIYYAPEEGSSLEEFGRSWLGRDAYSGNTVAQPSIEGISPQMLSDIVSVAARYGFHGTLKPPFFLRTPDLEEHLFKDIERFAATEKSIYLPRLCITEMGRFLALAPETRCPQINQIAERCVYHFDWYRRSPSIAEIKRRRAVGLTASQEHYLRRWGYPYVMKEFRFHLTLTGPISDPALVARIKKTLAGLVTERELISVKVESLCLFIQEQAKGPFLLHSRYPLGTDLTRKISA
ncbi:MAG: DUF1045 domain-containing protein [Desulfobacterales bacterium]